MLGLLLGNFSALIATHGLWIVALVIDLESMGLPLPGETCLVTASVYAGATGNLSLLAVIAAATAGAVIGDSVGFWIGRSVGQRTLLGSGKSIRAVARATGAGIASVQRVKATMQAEAEQIATAA